MSVDYQIISSLGLVYVKMRKALSNGELVSHLGDLAADDRYVPPMKKIVDFSGLNDAPMPTFGIDDFARFKSFYENELRGEHCVFVTPSSFRFGMGRVFGGYMGDADIKVAVARSLEEALALLGIAEDEFRDGLQVKHAFNAIRG